MKVLIWSDLPIPSGFGRISREVARRLAHRGYEVAAISIMYQDGPHGEPYYVWSAAPPRDLWKCNVEIVESARTDVIIGFQDFPYHYTLFWGTKIDFSRIAWIFVTPIDGEPIDPDWVRLVDFADGAMVISEFGVDAMRKHGKQVFLCPCGVDTNEFKPATEEEKQAIRQKAGIAPGAWIVGMFSQNQGRKNIPYMMEEFRDFCVDKPEAILYFDMEKESPAGWNLTKLSQQIGLPLNRLLCRPDINAQVPAIRDRYCMLDMHGVPAFREGWGLPLVESMACKIPTFAVDWSSGTEIVGDGRGYLIPRQPYMTYGTWGGARDAHPVPGALRAAMEDAYRDRLKASYVADVGYKWAIGRTWDKTTDAVESLVKQCMEQKQRGRVPYSKAAVPSAPVSNVQQNVGEHRGGGV